MRGLIVDPGVVIEFAAPLRPLTREEEAERDRFIAANRARGLAPAGDFDARGAARLVARIDEHGRDRALPAARLDRVGRMA